MPNKDFEKAYEKAYEQLERVNSLLDKQLQIVEERQYVVAQTTEDVNFQHLTWALSDLCQAQGYLTSTLRELLDTDDIE